MTESQPFRTDRLSSGRVLLSWRYDPDDGTRLAYHVAELSLYSGNIEMHVQYGTAEDQVEGIRRILASES
jgi:hypothetical protein